ncbi:unnamed protein product [Scytosiphon promiscuus]
MAIYRRRSPLNDMRCLSAVVMILAAAKQADGFYCAPGRVGGRAAGCTAISNARQVSSSSWLPRPTSTPASSGRSPRNALRASTMESRDKEAAGGGKEAEGSPAAQAAAPPVEATKGGDEGGDGDKAVTTPAAISAESRTVQLSKRVEAEGQMADSRAKRMADLSSELKKSFARKEEVEKMVADEVAQLGMKLRQERDIEIARAEDLKELLVEFEETIVEKQAEIEKEQDLLAQMQALRGQVEEASIRAPIEAAMAKKADVTSIEVMLLEDLVECKEKLEQELKSTSSRGETMNGVVAALPAEGDIERLRNYNWQDVQDLQEVLLSSVESMEASDAQVGALRTRLLDSVVQKREVLGEASSTELVQSDSGATRKMTTSRAFQVSADLSEEELLDSVAESSKNAALGVVKSVSVGADSLGSYLRSPAGQDVAASTVLVIGALAGAAASVGNAFKAAKKEFDDNAIDSEDMTSFDKIFNSLQSSVKAVQESPVVKAQLNEAGDLLTKQVPNAGARVGTGTVKALKGAASNTEIGNPVKEAVGSLQQFVVSVAALGTKYFSASRESRFQLPGGDASGESTDEQAKANAKLPSSSPPPKSMEELTAQKSAINAATKAAAAAASAPPASSKESGGVPAAEAKSSSGEKPAAVSIPSSSEVPAPKESSPAASTGKPAEQEAQAKPAEKKASTTTPSASEVEAPKAPSPVASATKPGDETKAPAPAPPSSEVPAPKMSAPKATETSPAEKKASVPVPPTPEAPAPEIAAPKSAAAAAAAATETVAAAEKTSQA